MVVREGKREGSLGGGQRRCHLKGGAEELGGCPLMSTQLQCSLHLMRSRSANECCPPPPAPDAESAPQKGGAVMGAATCDSSLHAPQPPITRRSNHSRLPAPARSSSLRGTMLTAQEQREHTALHPQFRQALTRGCKTQLKRGRLFVDCARLTFSPSGPCAFLSFLHLAVVDVGYEQAAPPLIHSASEG
eukprot:364007-Chlamydomonas_euryale.AAC.10